MGETAVVKAEPTFRIGGSEIHELLNLEPYGCERRLYYIKRCVEPDYPRETTDLMHRGNVLEPIIADEYEAITGRKLRKVSADAKSVRFPDFAGGHIDRHIVGFDNRGPGVLEIKTAGDRIYRKIKLEGLPSGYGMQLQWYIGLMGWEWGSFAIKNAETWEPIVYFDVERNDVLITLIIERAFEFQRKVENGPEPDRLDPKDRRCGNCQFRKSCQGNALLELLKENNSGIVSDPSLGGLAAEYREAKTLEDDASAYVAEVREKLEKAIGDRTAIETTGAVIYFRPQPGRKMVDGKKLETKYPEIYREVLTVSKPSRPLRVYPA